MNTQLKSLARGVVNPLFNLFNLELVKRGKGAFENYIPFKPTITGAEKMGLSVGDYIETMYDTPGSTEETINQMAKLGVFRKRIERVCEIGPGSGRYLEKVLQTCEPTSYEIYETSADWRNWLESKYQVIAHEANGSALSNTPSQSVDLIHAHKMFPGLPLFTACYYFEEMARVVRNDGKIVFDILTEQCLDDDTLKKWFSSHQWPMTMVAKQYAIDFFSRRGFSFNGNFFISMSPGITEYLIFTRQNF